MNSLKRRISGDIYEIIRKQVLNLHIFHFYLYPRFNGESLKCFAALWYHWEEINK